MKKFLTIAIAIAASFIAVPQAEARPRGGHTYVSSRASCGCPIYTQRYVAYYDHCGEPIFRTRILPVSHSCRRDSHRGHYGHNDHYRRGYSERPGIRIGPVFIPQQGYDRGRRY